MSSIAISSELDGLPCASYFWIAGSGLLRRMARSGTEGNLETSLVILLCFEGCCVMDIALQRGLLSGIFRH